MAGALILSFKDNYKTLLEFPVFPFWLHAECILEAPDPTNSIERFTFGMKLFPDWVARIRISAKRLNFIL